MTFYYHRSQLLYEKGETIQPGNWGRVIQGAGPIHNRFYPEYVLEKIRQAEFTEKPSRMSSCFVFEDFAQAQKWGRIVIQGIQEHVYAVAIPDGVSYHRGNVGWVDAMPLYRTFVGLDECVRNYWRGNDRTPDLWELLVAGPLTVVDRLDRLEENGHS